MTTEVQFTIDRKVVVGKIGQSILKAAEAAGIYIPRLCACRNLIPHGSCRVCSVRVNGKIQAAGSGDIAIDKVFIERYVDRQIGHMAENFKALAEVKAPVTI